MAHIQKHQFFDREQYSLPTIIAARDPETEEVTRYLIFYPTGNQFLQKADVVIFKNLAGGDQGRYEISYDQLSELATDRFSLVDEDQYLVEALTEEEYQDLFNRVKKLLGVEENAEVLEEAKPEEKDEVEMEEKEVSEDTQETKEEEAPYAEWSGEALEKEYYRIISIPNGRTNIDVLTSMAALMEEYKKRGLTMPGDTPQRTSAKASKGPGGSPKKWWQFWK